MNRSEKILHQNLVTFLRRYAEPVYPVLRFFKHTANEALGGGPKVRKFDRKTGRPIEVPLAVLEGGKMGVRAGVWDFELLYPNQAQVGSAPKWHYRGLAIEMKSKTGELSPEQKLWQEHYQANNWYTVEFRQWNTAAAFVIRWVGGDPVRFQGLE